jgi:hypothetical protein
MAGHPAPRPLRERKILTVYVAEINGRAIAAQRVTPDEWASPGRPVCPRKPP